MYTKVSGEDEVFWAAYSQRIQEKYSGKFSKLYCIYNFSISLRFLKIIYIHTHMHTSTCNEYVRLELQCFPDFPESRYPEAVLGGQSLEWLLQKQNEGMRVYLLHAGSLLRCRRWVFSTDAVKNGQFPG